MLCVRLPPQDEQKLTSVAARAGLSRSEWVRRVVVQAMNDEKRPAPFAVYTELLSQLPAAALQGPTGDEARNHSAILKDRFAAQYAAQQSAPLPVRKGP